MAAAARKPKKKATNGYHMPEPFPQGEILTDVAHKQWKLGSSIGKGGFGEIYSAQEMTEKRDKNYPYVIKIEPHENGPLFVEMHFYVKNAKLENIAAFKKKHKLKTFGMPAYLGSGSHEIGSNKYRFIVMEKFGKDIDTIRSENGGNISVAAAFQLAWQMTYVLEYIHELGYVHADLKGANILMGIKAENKNQAYLVDFGLATKTSSVKEFKPNPKKANDGTIEYLSRDAHQGVPTRRGDLEILGYNLIHWLGGKLPWETCLNDVKAVQQGKEQAMKNIPKFVKSCFSGSKANIDTIVNFLKYINTLNHNEAPDYEKIRELFRKEVEKNGNKVNGPLEFYSERKRRSLDENEDTPEKRTKEEPKKVRRGRSKQVKKEAELLQTNEVKDVGQKMDVNTAEKKTKENDREEPKKMARRLRKVKEEETELSQTNEVMTDAMKEIIAKMENKAPKKRGTTRKRL